MPFNINSGTNFAGVNFIDSINGINVSPDKVVWGNTGSVVWTKAVQQDVTVLQTSYEYWENHIGTDKKVLVYGPIDASLYKAIKFTVTKAIASQSWNTYYFDIGFSSGTDPEPNTINNTTANIVLGRGYVDYYGNEDNYANYNTQEVTLNFAETSGNVYVFMGVVNGNGYGDVCININSTATIIPRY